MWTVDRYGRSRAFPPPDLRKDRIAGERTRPEEKRKRLEDAEFLGGESDRPPLVPDFVAAYVHPQLPVAQRRRFGFRGPRDDCGAGSP